MVTQNTIKCTGCGVCAAICPKNCLEIALDKNGFYAPRLLDSKECINCNICEKVCPKSISPENIVPIKTASAASNTADTLSTTSSGGICYELANNAISQGKKVCGCIYDYNTHRAIHSVIENKADLDATKGSKYFQSYTPDAFSKIFDGNEWVVFGTPCQVAAIDAAAKTKKNREKLLLVDFFCHGTPSMNLWKKYIEENSISTISKIDFRSKEFGWHSFSLKFTYDNGTTKSDFNNNMFYNFFFGNLCLNDSCYDCHFKALKSCADIRVGDYWGEKYKDNCTGVSCVVILTDKGYNAVEEISDYCIIRQEDADDILKAQMVKSPPLLQKERLLVLKALTGKRKLKSIFNTTLFPYRLKCKIKSLLRRD